MDTWTKRSDTGIAHHQQGIVCAVIFDYGGVLADEGFRNGCYAIAAHYRLDEEESLTAITWQKTNVIRRYLTISCMSWI